MQKCLCAICAFFKYKVTIITPKELKVNVNFIYHSFNDLNFNVF